MSTEGMLDPPGRAGRPFIHELLLRKLTPAHQGESRWSAIAGEQA